MTKRQKIFTIALACTSLALFVAILILVTTQNSWLLSLDGSIANFCHLHRTRLADYVFVAVSYLGETMVIAIFCAILLLLPNRKKLGIPVTIITIFSVGLNFLIKTLVMRSRPEGMFLTQDTLGYQMPDGFSFPSGHAQTANIFYVSLAYLLAKNSKKRWQKTMLWVLTPLFCVTMCVARVYLCVHFLSDVLAGIALMIFIFCISLLLAKKKTNVC